MMKAQVLLSQHMEDLWCEDTPLTKPDMEMCNSLVPQKPPAAIGQANRIELLRADTVRRHFWSLTTSFLEPFQQYFLVDGNSQMPETAGQSGSAGYRVLPEYDAVDFLHSLETYDFASVLKDRFASHVDCVELYRLFIGSRNFEAWFSRQRQAAASDLGIPYSDEFLHKTGTGQPSAGSGNYVGENGILRNTDENRQGSGGWKCEDEVLLVEKFFKMEETLMSPGEGGTNGFIDSDTKEQIAAVFQSMPPDLMQALLSSPAREGLVKKLKSIPELNRHLCSIQLT